MKELIKSTTKEKELLLIEKEKLSELFKAFKNKLPTQLEARSRYD